MNTSEQVDKILPKLLEVKKHLGTVVKGKENDYFSSSYADINDYLDAVEPLLNDNGMILLQPTQSTEGGNVLSTRIYDVESSQYIESSMNLIGEKDMQKAGSAVTYSRRYTLSSLLGMKSSEDDDGNAASSKTKKKTSSSTTEKKEAKTSSKGSSFRRKRKEEVASASSTEEEGEDW